MPAVRDFGRGAGMFMRMCVVSCFFESRQGDKARMEAKKIESGSFFLKKKNLT